MTKDKPIPNLDYELRLWSEGYRCVAGLDEAGRGAWAGPVVAAAVILPPGEPDLLFRLDGVRDSKQLSPTRREVLLESIREHALSMAIGAVPPAEIDRIGIVPATRRAMAIAIEALGRNASASGASVPGAPVPSAPVPGASVLGAAVPGARSLAADHLLIDYLRLPEVELPQICLPKGDTRVLSIAAASIVAKVSRDRMMVDLDVEYPGYGFARHKGYGTPQHQAALAARGPSATHRFSFAPLQRLRSRVANGEDGRATSAQPGAGSPIPNPEPGGKHDPG